MTWNTGYYHTRYKAQINPNNKHVSVHQAHRTRHPAQRPHPCKDSEQASGGHHRHRRGQSVTIFLYEPSWQVNTEI